MNKCIDIYFLLVLFKTITCATVRSDSHQQDEVIAVVTLFRHGDRSPTDSFPNDPYYDVQYWPQGYGQLTNPGITRMYDLGRWFRNRYNSFLPYEYSSKDIYIRSTDPDRCLMSADAVLAGLYPPKGRNLWNKELLWQPIPVHTAPIGQDEVLSMSKLCPRYEKLLEKTLDSENIKEINTKYSNFFKQLSKLTGWEEVGVKQAGKLHLVLDAYSHYNSSFLPTWAKDGSLDQNTLAYLAAVNQQRYTLTKPMRRLLTGPFWSNFLAHFDNAMKNVSGTPKFLMLSAHDTTIVSLLNSMAVFDMVPPCFGAAIIWELRRNVNGTHSVKLFYKNCDEEKDLMSFENFGEDCDCDEFKNLLTPLVVSGKRWERECADKNQEYKKIPKTPFFT